MIIGSNSNPYKKLLEEQSDKDVQQEEYLITLLMGLISSYEKEYEYVMSVENQESMNEPIKEYTDYFEAKKDSFNEEYDSTIKKIIEEFPELENRQDKNPNFMQEVLLDFYKNEGFDNIEDEYISLDDDIKIGYLQCLTYGNVYLEKDMDLPKYSFDKYTKQYHVSYRDRISVRDLLNKLDAEYVENNYEDLIDSDEFTSHDTEVLNELDCKSDIIDAIVSNSYIEFNEVQFEAFGDKVKRDSLDYVVYVNKEEFFFKFKEYLLNNNYLGIRSEDNAVWEEEEE